MQGTLQLIYQHLNSLTMRCTFLASDRRHARYFSTLDLTWQVPTVVVDQEKTDFIIPMWLYEFLQMLFGLNNARATIQRLMELCLGDLNQECLLIYLDDIIIFWSTFKEHLQRVK